MAPYLVVISSEASLKERHFVFLVVVVLQNGGHHS